MMGASHVSEKQLAMYPTRGSPRGGSSRRSVNVILLLLILISASLLLYLSSLQIRDEQQEHAQAETPLLAAHDKAQQLDIKYASHLISQFDEFEPHKDPSTETLSATIVLGRLAEDEANVQWVFDQLHDITDPVVYVVDDPNAPGPHLEKNHGREAAVYLTYIVENYNKLHNVTFFWHADETVWHNNMLLSWDSVQTINRMDRANVIKSGYVPSRCDHWPGCPQWIRFNPSQAENRLDPHRLEEMYTPEFLGRLFPNETDFPPYFSGTCCSQFALSKDRIRARPKESYQRILDWVLEYQDDDRSGMVLEFLWPYIFSGQGSVCPAMEECYCKTYNFCMRNPADVQALTRWNELRTRREEVKWQLNFVEGALESKKESSSKNGASTVELLSVEEKFAKEMDRLQWSLDKLTNRTWGLREDIIHRWRLPAPPTGW